MKLTQITVSYGLTQSLPEYSNVKPNLTLTATLDPGDDPEQIEAQLWAMAKEAVQGQIDDALERNDVAAKYSDEPRFQVMRTYWNEWEHRGQPKPPQIVVIFPNEVSLKQHVDTKLVHTGRGDSRELRYTHALRVAAQSAIEHESALLDCADGDLSPLIEALAAAPVATSEADVAPTADHPF